VLGVYTTVGWIAIGVGVAVLAVSPLIRRLMHLDTLKDEELAGRPELAENQAAGLFPKGETKPMPNMPGGGL
jgi:POT family proton-dependent oligopeptide transporter